MIAIPNMSKPESCDKCPIHIAQVVGIYCDDKDGKLKRVKITGCDSSKYNGNTLAEDYKLMYKDCPIIDIVECWECEYYQGHEKYCEIDHFAREHGFCYSGKRRKDD